MDATERAVAKPGEQGEAYAQSAPLLAFPGATPPAQAIAEVLNEYFAQRAPGIRVVTCERIPGGYETFIYHLQLQGRGTLPVAQPLILRLYQGPGMAARSAWEAAAIARARAAGIPAPAVHLYEQDATILGAPFLLLDHARGERMDAAAAHASPLAVARMLRDFARVQTAIHRIDWPEGRALAPGHSGSNDLGPFVWAPDRLAQARRALLARRLEVLLPIVDWLEEREAAVRGPEVFIHGDYHPYNVFVAGGRVSDVIDWGAGGFAGVHEDIGWTSLLLATATAAEPAADRGLAAVRTLGRRVYLAAIWEACRIGRTRLRYGEVYAALRWLLLFLPSALPDAGPPVLNPDARAFATPLYVRRVLAFVNRRTRLRLDLRSRGLPPARRNRT